MNGETIIERFDEIIDDSVSAALALMLANIVIHAIEDEIEMPWLKAYDESKSASSGDTYLTMKALPADFSHPLKVTLGTDYQPIEMIDFIEREVHRDSAYKWYIDWANEEYAICGNKQTSQTIKMFYFKFTDDITLATSPGWPDRFHNMIPFGMAAIQQGSMDPDTISVRQMRENSKEFNYAVGVLIAHVAKIQLATMNHRHGMEQGQSNLDMRSDDLAQW